MTKSTNDSRMILRKLLQFQSYEFLNFELYKVGQGHGVEFSHHSMENVKIYKLLHHIFALALTVSEI